MSLSLVMVLWQDAFDSSSGWTQIADYKPEPQFVVNVGFMLPDLLAGHISITGSYSPAELPDLKEVGCISHIPQEMVRSVVVLDQPDFPVL